MSVSVCLSGALFASYSELYSNQHVTHGGIKRRAKMVRLRFLEIQIRDTESAAQAAILCTKKGIAYPLRFPDRPERFGSTRWIAVRRDLKRLFCLPKIQSPANPLAGLLSRPLRALPTMPGARLASPFAADRQTPDPEVANVASLDLQLRSGAGSPSIES